MILESVLLMSAVTSTATVGGLVGLLYCEAYHDNPQTRSR